MLREEDLQGANRQETGHGDGDPREANLRGATVTEEQLEQAESLERTIMPQRAVVRELAQEQGPRGGWVERRFLMSSESCEDGF